MIDPVLARLIKLVAFDIDGVMTDGGIYLGDVDGKRLELKRYDIQDGLGVSLLHRAGVRVAIVTGRISESVRLRGAELGIEDVVQGPDGHKLEGFLRVLQRRGIRPEECAFVGDDFPDLPLLRIVGMRACVGNAAPEVSRECQIHLDKTGGRGAVREFCELFLKARGAWDDAWNGYVAERSGDAPASAGQRR
jgi:3-deoxy-D-manno-octulosonate 8-phosphate phosphatase (KDO 8-P phosphatase)